MLEGRHESKDPMPTRPPLAQRREIGAYYTPATLAEALCSWAILRTSDTVLEPSFGGCSFLKSSKARLEELGCLDPNRQLFGCDVDPVAFEYLFDDLGLAQLHGHFLLTDFLSVSPNDFSARFDAVVGNPPYVRHHEFKADQRQSARKIREIELPSLSGLANLWAYFVVHACQFLKTGGRVAWLLPSAFEYADYSKQITTFLCKNFAQVTVARLTERVFKSEGADEATIVVTATGWRSPQKQHRQVRRIELSSLQDLRLELSSTPRKNSRTSSAAWKVFDVVALKAKRLGTMCDIELLPVRLTLA